MHIPDGIITIDQALIYWILTILIMAICFYKLQKDSQKDKKIVSMAIFSVFTVIITSLSIPSPLGVPIHFFLIPLIAIILGATFLKYSCIYKFNYTGISIEYGRTNFSWS